MSNYQELDAAFDWGRAVGEIGRINGDPKGDARGSYLRGELRAQFEQGLDTGYDWPRCWGKRAL